MTADNDFISEELALQGRKAINLLPPPSHCISSFLLNIFNFFSHHRRVTILTNNMYFLHKENFHLPRWSVGSC